METGETVKMRSLRRIKCILCHQVIIMPDLPPSKYINHLMTTHDIIFDIDFLIHRTLVQQYPELARPDQSCPCAAGNLRESSAPGESSAPRESSATRESSAPKESSTPRESSALRETSNLADSLRLLDTKSLANDICPVRSSMQECASKLQEIFPQSISITPILKRKGGEVKEEAVKRVKGEEEEEKNITNGDIQQKEGDPSWSLGCLYRCQICSVKFQTLSSFRSHLFFHKVTVTDYTATHGDPGVSFQHHTCLRCGDLILQDPWFLREHLATHDISLSTYSVLVENKAGPEDPDAVLVLGETSGFEEEEATSSRSSTSKSSPGAQLDLRKSVDNLSESPSSPEEAQIKACTVNIEQITTNINSVNNNTEDVSDDTNEGGEEGSEDGMDMFDVVNIKTEPDIELGYFSPAVENYLDMSQGADRDLENEVTQNIIRDLTKTAESFFQNQSYQHQQYQQQQVQQYRQQQQYHQQQQYQQQQQLLQQHFQQQQQQITACVQQGVQSAGRIPWYHGCLFQCAVENCTRQFFEKAFLKSHVDTQHTGINFDQYLIEYGNTSTITNHHECEICGKGIMHTARNIESHLVGQHGVTMAHYWDEFKHSINIVNLEIRDERLLLDALQGDQEAKVGYKQPTVAGGENLNLRNSSVDWADRCIYECKECSPAETFDTHSKVSYHVKKKHSLAMKDYTTKYGRAMIYEEKHTCQVCGSHVLWERSSIYQHIYQVHNRMTMEEYGRLMTNYKDVPAEVAQKSSRQMSYVESNIDWTNECVFECKLCQPTRKFNSKNKISFHVKRMHTLKMTEYNAKYGTSLLSRSWHTCQICGISILCDYFSLYQHVTKGHKVSLNDYQEQLMCNFESEKIEWLNRCVFGCKICKQEFIFRSEFISHIEMAHNMSQNVYRKDYGSFFKSKEIHICQIKSCAKKFAWETLSLKAHIEKKHEMQAAEYYERFMITYAEKSPSCETGRKGSMELVDSRINQCEYQCQLCDEVYQVDRYYSEHLKNVHNINKNDYKACFGLGLSKKVAQNCQLCKGNPKEFLMDQAYLGVHIRITHKQSINSYLQKLENMMEIEEEIKEGEEWCYQCRYVCCETVFRQKWKFDRHISGAHGMLVSEFYEQNRHSPGYFLRKEYHSCKVCSKELICDKGPLQSHVRTHDLSLDSYYQNFVVNCVEPDSDRMDKAVHNNVIHTCQMCHKNVLRNTEQLVQYLGEHGYKERPRYGPQDVVFSPAKCVNPRPPVGRAQHPLLQDLHRMPSLQDNANQRCQS